MIIRQLTTPEELAASQRVDAICFEFPLDYQKTLEQAREREGKPEDWEQREAEKQLCPLPSDAFPPEITWGAFSPQGELMGRIGVNPYTVHYDGHQVLMGGIGGVATLPEYRRGGVIRGCLTRALEEMADQGFVFSCLYPFSRAYYRQFGYENGPLIREYTVSLSAIRLEPGKGKIHQLMPGDDLSPLLQVYSAFFQDVNLSVYRRVFDRELEKANLLEQKRYLYVWYNEAGEPRGFFLSKKTGNRVLDCTTSFALKNGFLALDANAYQGMLSFAAKTFAADYDSIRFQALCGIRLDSFFAEGNDVDTRLSYNGMVRVVNVEKALELCRCRGEGRLVLRVEDPQLPQNTGTWALSFAPGRENQVRPTGEPPQISLPVQELGPLLCGIREAKELPWMPLVQVLDPQAPFDQVFYTKPCHTMDLF